MTHLQRPDLSGVGSDVLAYIEALEQLAAGQAGSASEDSPAEMRPPSPPEPANALNVLSASQGGLIKRTSRHLYERQRRGGMGVFDLDAAAGDVPQAIGVVDEGRFALLLTTMARAFLRPVSQLAPAPVRAKGLPLADALGLLPGEGLACVLPAARGTQLALLSQLGFVRVLPAHVVGQSMAPGTALYRHAEYGGLAAACWTAGGGDLFVATRLGQAIRFPERALPVGGGQAIRLNSDDSAVAVEAVRPPEGNAIFMLGADGRGTIRLMSGFAANKAPGGGGKAAFKTDRLAGVAAVNAGDDIFAITQLSKIIRFAADEVPAKEGVVQGVVCMTLRNDSCVAVTASPALVEVDTE